MDITKTASNIFTEEDSLISTKIDEINLRKDELGELKIQMVITGFSGKSNYSKINLLFSDIIEFKFYYNNNYHFYNVENYKLLHIADQIYISFDPDKATHERSKNDLDLIFAKKLELSIIK